MYMLIYTTFILLFFFFNDTATTEIYTLSLHDALPIWRHHHLRHARPDRGDDAGPSGGRDERRRRPADRYAGQHLWRSCQDRKSTRLNSSHANISYAVFCLKKKKKQSNIAIVPYINTLN